MKDQIKYRLYYGHDCNSVDGFNDGYYIDEDTHTDTIEEACNRAKIELKKRYGSHINIEEQDGGESSSFQLITGYYDNDGNDLTKEAFTELNENEEAGSYLYVYISIEIEHDPIKSDEPQPKIIEKCSHCSSKNIEILDLNTNEWECYDCGKIFKAKE